MSDTVHGPWEQAENSDYDEQKPGSGDSHEDEFDDEYGEQQPKGDPNQPDNKLEDAYQADIEYWEDVARLNALARPYDPDAPVTAQPSSLDPDDFDRADSAYPAAPPTPGGAAYESEAATTPSLAFDPAVPFAEARVDSGSPPAVSQLASPNPDEPYQPVIVDPGPPSADSAAGEPGVTGGPAFDPAVPFADAFGDSSASPLSQMGSPDRFEANDSHQAGSPSFDPEVEF